MDVISKNLRTEDKSTLKTANKAWTDCIAKNFLNQWLNGDNITINDVCKDEYEKMSELDASVYGPIPFKTPASIL
jgi:hypothetical protein